MKRIILGFAVALALLGAGGAAALHVRNNIQESQGVQRVAALCSDIKQKIRDDGAVVQVNAGASTVVVLGDSYAAGDFLPHPRTGWPALLGMSQNLTVQVDAIGGTGFINGGPCGTQSFTTRVDNVLALNPSMVIVEGGLNDHGKPTVAIESSVAALLDDLEEVPAVAVVGPTNAPAITDDAQVDAALKAAVENKGRTYVSAYRWDLPFLPDGVHLTEDGHAIYAKQLSAAIPKG